MAKLELGGESLKLVDGLKPQLIATLLAPEVAL